MNQGRKLLALLLSGLFALALFGCEKKDTSTQVEVKDKLLGGKEIKKTEVTRKGDRVQVKEKKTETNDSGTVTKEKTKVEGDDLDSH